MLCIQFLCLLATQHLKVIRVIDRRLVIYIHFDSISAISRWWEGENESMFSGICVQL